MTKRRKKPRLLKGGGLRPVGLTPQEEVRRRQSSRCHQKLACCSAMLTMVAVGTVYGWSTTGLRRLKSGTDDVPLKLSHDEYSWITSVIIYSSIISSLVCARWADRFGRKYCLLVCSAMITAGWFITYAATTVRMLCYARVLHGIGVGIARTINPMFVSEVADINIRGMLCTLITVAAYAGTLIACDLEYWMKYNSLLVVFIILSFISFLSNTYFPETPYFLVAKGRKKEACKSLRYYKGIIDPNEAKTEIRALRAQTRYELHPQSRYELDQQYNVDSRASDNMDEIHMDGTKNTAFTKVQVILYRSNKKALFIMFGLIMAQQCGKNFITMQYPERLYRKTNIVSDSYTATLLVQVVNILSSICTMFKVDSVGRRTLLILSTLGTSVTLCTFAYYLLLAEHKLQGHMFDILLPIVLIIYQVTFQIGLGTIPTVLLCDLFPMELRGFVGATTVIFDGTIELTVLILYYFITDIIGACAAYHIFATVCILAFLMVFIWIPETKGKTYNEIEELLVGKNLHSSNEEARIDESDIRI